MTIYFDSDYYPVTVSFLIFKDNKVGFGVYYSSYLLKRNREYIYYVEPQFDECVLLENSNSVLNAFHMPYAAVRKGEKWGILDQMPRDVTYKAIELNPNNPKTYYGRGVAYKHIGNIKVGGINHYHRYADIGFLIGEKNYWGKGFATEAIALATDFAFNTLKLHKVWGGLYSPNIGSLRAFQKNGYEQEGIKKSQYLLNGVYYDDIMFGKVNPDE